MSSSPTSFSYYFYLVGCDNTVGIATRYGLDSPATDSRWLFGPHNLPYNWHLVSFPGIRQPGRGVGHPPHLTLYLYSTSGVFMASSRVNFIFLLFKSQGRAGEAWKPSSKVMSFLPRKLTLYRLSADCFI